MQLLGFNGVSAFFDYTNELRIKYPVILENQSFDANGNSTANIPMSEKKDLILYRDWAYYKVFDE